MIMSFYPSFLYDMGLIKCCYNKRFNRVSSCVDPKRTEEAIDLRTSEEITEIEVSKEKVTKSQFKVSSSFL